MLGIILSPKQIVAGSFHEGFPRFISWGEDSPWSLHTDDPEQELKRRFADLCARARTEPWFSGQKGKPCPIMVASSLHEDVSDLRLSLNTMVHSLGIDDFQLSHVDHLVWPFLAGESATLPEGGRALVLDGLGSAVEWLEVERRKGVVMPDASEVGSRSLFREEKIIRRKLSHFGPEFGREKILSALMKEFSQAGINLDAATQTSLAKQVTQVELPETFHISRQVGVVTIEAEAHFAEEQISAMLLGEFQSLKSRLSASALKENGFTHLHLMGTYLYHPQFIAFLKEDCQLNTELRLSDIDEDADVFASAISGMQMRLQQIGEAEMRKAEAESKRKEAEAKKAAITAELRMKDERDQLLYEIRQTCLHPSKREDYEKAFVSRGEALGIPDLVIKWNITEALSRVELVQEGEEVGLRMADPAPKEEVLPPIAATVAPTVVSPAPPEPAPTVVATPEKAPQEPKQEPKKVVEAPITPVVVESAPKPEPVYSGARAGAVVAEAVQVKEAPAAKPSRKRDQVSLDDIFVWKGDLPDPEFISRKATFHQDGDIKVVRILSADQIANGEAIGNFRRVYDKELAYFTDMSEVSEGREGMYYYRKYTERQTLREYAMRTGLANKKGIEDLSSQDLKFILLLLKEVQDLPVSHGNLNADNILILNKRRWNLSKDLEIKFIEFSSQDVSPEKSVMQAHQALGSVIGEAVYGEFKEKFQL